MAELGVSGADKERMKRGRAGRPGERASIRASAGRGGQRVSLRGSVCHCTTAGNEAATAATLNTAS